MGFCEVVVRIVNIGKTIFCTKSSEDIVDNYIHDFHFRFYIFLHYCTFLGFLLQYHFLSVHNINGSANSLLHSLSGEIVYNIVPVGFGCLYVHNA